MSYRIPVLAVTTLALATPAAAGSWGWGTGCGCAPAVYAAPVLAAAPVVVAPVYVVRQPIFVVNQGPVHAGPDVTVVPGLRVEGPPRPYPYIRTWRGFDRYAVRRPYYRPYRHYRPHHIYRPRPLPPK